MLRRMSLIVLVSILVVGCSSTGSRDKTPTTAKGLHTKLWYDPGSAVLVIAGHACGQDVKVSESSTAVAVGTYSRPTQPGQAGCPAPVVEVYKLEFPVGSRALVGRAGSPLSKYRWSARLHLSIVAFRPQTIDAGRPTASSWRLSYRINRPTGDDFVLLTSQRASGSRATTAVTVRGRQALAHCAATVCWIERGVRYALSLAGPGGKPLHGGSDVQHAAFIASRLSYV